MWDTLREKTVAVYVTWLNVELKAQFVRPDPHGVWVRLLEGNNSEGLPEFGRRLFFPWPSIKRIEIDE